MLCGKKLKNIRKRFGFDRELFASIFEISLERMNKLENDETKLTEEELNKILDILKVSKKDFLTNKIDVLPLKITKTLDKKLYNSKFSSYSKLLSNYFSSPYEVYVLTRRKRLNIYEWIVEIFVVPEIGLATTYDDLSDMSPYYLIKKENVKLLVNIKKWTLNIYELPVTIDETKFKFKNNIFKNVGKLKVNK